MKKLPANIYDDIKDTAGRMYGYEMCNKATALAPSFPESEFYVLGEGQTVYFYTESQLNRLMDHDVDPMAAGPGSIVQIVHMGGDMWRFYSVVIPGKRSYDLSST